MQVMVSPLGGRFTRGVKRATSDGFDGWVPRIGSGIWHIITTGLQAARYLGPESQFDGWFRCDHLNCALIAIREP